MIDIRLAVASDLIQSYAPAGEPAEVATILAEASAASRRSPAAYLQHIFSRPRGALTEIEALVRRKLEQRVRFYTYLSIAREADLLPVPWTRPIAERIATDLGDPALGEFLRRHPIPGMLFENSDHETAGLKVTEQALSLFWDLLDINKGSDESPEFDLAFEFLRYGRIEGIGLRQATRRLLQGPRRSRSKSVNTLITLADGLMDIFGVIQETHNVVVESESFPRLYYVLLLRHLYLLGFDTVARQNLELVVDACLEAGRANDTSDDETIGDCCDACSKESSRS